MRNETAISRRDLVAGTIAGTAATGLLGIARSAQAEDAIPDTDHDVAWDGEYDVVVLGLGGAGANAAVAAYEEGVKVLVCEKAPEGQEPCNTKVAGQSVMSTDDADALYTYLSQLMGEFNNWDEEALRGFCEGAEGNFDWMCGPLGGDPEIVYPSFNPMETFDFEKGRDNRWHQVDDAWGQGRPGWIDNWAEFPEIPESKNCIVLSATGTHQDSGYYNLCMEAVNSRIDDDRLTVWKGCPGKRLITDAEGAVIGCVVEKDGAELKIKANGGVCLCTGGFENNMDMLASYTQTPYSYPRAGLLNTGDGIKMAQEVGADLWHMSNVSGFGWAFKSPNLTTGVTVSCGNGIFAGLNGARFMNEMAENRHGRINIGGRWIMMPLPLPAYYIVDANQIGTKLVSTFSEGNADEIASGVVLFGETIEELSQKIRDLGEAPDFNLNGELDKALEKYNKHCHANNDEGEEDDFGRMCTVPVETGPFYAVEIGATLLNTQGGPRRNGMAQVINTEGYPIEGLFSGGELGSIFADMYNGGGNLGETIVFGRFAGQNAAKRAKGEFEGATEKAMTHQEKLDAEAAAAAEADSAAVDLSAVADGTYEGSGQGYGGKITVSVTVEGGQITGCEVMESSETETIGELALPTYCEEIVETQDPAAVDIASGASNTLRGFQTAVKDALSQA